MTLLPSGRDEELLDAGKVKPIEATHHFVTNRVDPELASGQDG